MKIANISVDRPVAVTMMIMISVVLGLTMLMRIPIELFPDTDMPIVTVSTKYFGASPEEVESQVTKILEDEFASLDHLDTISSTSKQDVSSIMIQFDWGTDLDIAAVDVQAKVDEAIKDLPADLTEDPLVEKLNPNDKPSLQYSLSAPDSYSLGDLYQIADKSIKSPLERLENVASVEVFGGRENEIKILLNPDQMKNYGLSIPVVLDVIAKDTRNYAIGKIDQGTKELSIKVSGEAEKVEDFNNLTFTTPAGSRVYLKDFAKVETGYVDTDETIYFNGKNAVGIYVYKQAEGNTVELSKLAKEEIALIQQQLPADVQLDLIIDDADYINASIKNLVKDGFIGSAIAVTVLFLFLGRISSTLVVSLAIPITVISTFSLMYLSGITINLITLAAVGLAVGMMVDDAVVVMQNIYRHYHEEGRSIIEAAKIGTQEVGTAVMAATATKVIVFLPMMFVDGLAAQIFNPLALTVSYALLASLVVSLTVTPMLSAALLKHTYSGEGRFKWFFDILEKAAAFVKKYTQGLENGYFRLLKWSLHHRKTVLSIAVITFILGIAFVPLVGGEFMPGMDSGQLSIEVKMPKGTQLEETDRVVKDIMTDLEEIPEVDMYLVTMGSDQNSKVDIDLPDYALIDVTLVDMADRKRETIEVVDELRSSLSRFPGADIKVKEKGFIASSMFSSDPVYLTIKGNDQEELKRVSNEIEKIVKEVPGTREVETSFDQGQPEAQIYFNREKLKDYGLDIYSVSQTVRTAVSGQVVGVYRTSGEELDVRVQYDENNRSKLNDLNQIYVLSLKTGTQIPLGELVMIEETLGPSTIYHEDKIKMAYVTADIFDRDLQSVNNDILERIKDLDLPNGFTIEFGGESKDMNESFGDLGSAFILAVILIYMVMAAEFESYKYPFIIMFTLPLTLFGVTSSLALTGRSLSVPSLLGMIMLVGIVVGNAIVLIEYTNQLRKEQGMGVYEALLKAGPTRLTPILMTTLTTVLGLFPFALGIGEGAETHAPMATVVVGGLTIATLLTLIVIPVLYTLFERKNFKITSGLDTSHVKGSLAK